MLLSMTIPSDQIKQKYKKGMDRNSFLIKNIL